MTVAAGNQDVNPGGHGFTPILPKPRVDAILDGLARSNKRVGWLFVCAISILIGWMVEPIAKPAYFVAPAKAKLHVHKAGVQKIVKRLDTVFRRYDVQGLL
jgi:hypothetical protein